jgi:hypothetical protein
VGTCEEGVPFILHEFLHTYQTCNKTNIDFIVLCNKQGNLAQFFEEILSSSLLVGSHFWQLRISAIEGHSLLSGYHLVSDKFLVFAAGQGEGWEGRGALTNVNWTKIFETCTELVTPNSTKKFQKF